MVESTMFHLLRGSGALKIVEGVTLKVGFEGKTIGVCKAV